MEQLKRLREERGLSQVKLAARADLNPATVNQIERGVRDPSTGTLRKLASALDVSLVDLIEDSGTGKVESRSSLEPTFNDVLEEERPNRAALSGSATGITSAGAELEVLRILGELEEKRITREEAARQIRAVLVA